MPKLRNENQQEKNRGKAVQENNSQIMSQRDAIAAKYGRGKKTANLDSTGNPAIIGEELFAQAESKCVSVKGFWGTLTGKGEALEEAEALYVQAANKFKMAQAWDRAGLSFANAAKMASR